jgi:hypothetical protein
MGVERGVYRALVGIMREREYWGDPSVDGRLHLIWAFRIWDAEVWTGVIWNRTDTDVGHL